MIDDGLVEFSVLLSSFLKKKFGKNPMRKVFVLVKIYGLWAITIPKSQEKWRFIFPVCYISIVGWPWICPPCQLPSRTENDRKTFIWDSTDLHSREKIKTQQTMRRLHKLLLEVPHMTSSLTLLARAYHVTKPASARKKMYQPPAGRDTTKRGTKIYGIQSYDTPQWLY